MWYLKEQNCVRLTKIAITSLRVPVLIICKAISAEQAAVLAAESGGERHYASHAERSPRKRLSSPPIIVQVLLALLVVTAALFDSRQRRVPNWLVLLGLVLGIGSIRFFTRPEDSGCLSRSRTCVPDLLSFVLASGNGCRRCQADGGSGRHCRMGELARNHVCHGATGRPRRARPGGIQKTPS